MNEVTASAMRWLTICTSLAGSSLALFSALSRNTCAVVPVVVEIFWPFRSASDLMPESSRTHSCAVAYSTLLIRKTLPCPRAGKFDTTAPVESMSRLPPIMAWNSSRPVVKAISSSSSPCLAKLPDLLAGPDLAVHRGGVQVAHLHLGAPCAIAGKPAAAHCAGLGRSARKA
jgi:hypothetical protein